MGSQLTSIVTYMTVVITSVDAAGEEVAVGLTVTGVEGAMHFVQTVEVYVT